MSGGLVVDLLVILGSGLVASLVCRSLHVSSLIGFLITGVLLGPGALGWVSSDSHDVERVAEAGVFLLLFAIGVEFSLEELLRLGRHLIMGGSLQMLLTAVPVGLGLWAWGTDGRSALLLSCAVAFSSTVLVFKTLAEWGQSDTRHGRRAIGILLFQDLALIPLLLLIPALTGAGPSSSGWDHVQLLLTIVAFVSSIVVLQRVLADWLIPRLTRHRSPDVVILFTLVTLSGITLTAYHIGLPPAVGAFAAGLVFSGNRWTKQIDALLLPFRETFSAIFFVSLGLLLEPQIIGQQLAAFLGGVAGTVLVKTAAATLALRLTGLTWTRSLGMGMGLAHIGEFAFLVAAFARGATFLSGPQYQLFVSIGLGTLILTPWLLKTGLRWSQDPSEAPRGRSPEPVPPGLAESRALVIGAGPIGRQVASRLETGGHNVTLVDLSPLNLYPFAQQGFHTVAGDATDAAILHLADAGESGLVVISIPDDDGALVVVRQLRKMNPAGYILVRCRYQANVPVLRKAGANRVISEEAQASKALMAAIAELGGSSSP